MDVTWHQKKQLKWREKFRQQAETLTNQTLTEKVQAARLHRTNVQVNESRIRPVNRESRCTCTRVDCSYLKSETFYSIRNCTCELHRGHITSKPAIK